MIPHSDCKTNGGIQPNVPCVFPFRYGLRIYMTCITKDHDAPWCPTQTDLNGNYLNGKWGNCRPGCPVKSEGKTIVFRYLNLMVKTRNLT